MIVVCSMFLEGTTLYDRSTFKIVAIVQVNSSGFLMMFGGPVFTCGSTHILQHTLSHVLNKVKRGQKEGKQFFI